MKKSIIAAMLLLSATFATNAQSNLKQYSVERDSIIVAYRPDSVKIVNNDNRIAVEVSGNGYNYKIEKGGLAQSTSIIKEKNSDWNFDIPFIGSKKEKEEKQRKQYNNNKFEMYLLGKSEFGIGLAAATDQAEGMDAKMANGGVEFTLNKLLSWQYKPYKSGRVELNFGVNWRNFRMKGDNRFLKDGNNLTIAPYPTGAEIKFSRVKVFSMTLELMYRQKLAKHIDIGVGPVVNFNTHGSIKTRYKVDGEKKKETSSNIHQNTVTADFKAEVGIRPLAFYIKYSPMNILDTNYSPGFHPFSAGIIIGHR